MIETNIIIIMSLDELPSNLDTFNKHSERKYPPSI